MSECVQSDTNSNARPFACETNTHTNARCTLLLILSWFDGVEYHSYTWFVRVSTDLQLFFSFGVHFVNDVYFDHVYAFVNGYPFSTISFSSINHFALISFTTHVCSEWVWTQEWNTKTIILICIHFIQHMLEYEK